MIKQMAWNTFKNTGNLNTLMELKQIEELENKIKAEQYGNYKDQRNSNSRA